VLSSGFFRKKKPHGTMPETPRQLENRRNTTVVFAYFGQKSGPEGVCVRTDFLPANTAGGVFSKKNTAGWRRFAAWQDGEFAGAVSSHAGTEGPAHLHLFRELKLPAPSGVCDLQL